MAIVVDLSRSGGDVVKTDGAGNQITYQQTVVDPHIHTQDTDGNQTITGSFPSDDYNKAALPAD